MRLNGLVTAAMLVAGTAVAWFGSSLPGMWTAPVVGWLPLHLSTALASFACGRAGGSTANPAGRRFWRHMATALAFICAATVSNYFDVLRGGAGTQPVTGRTLVLYMCGVLVALWSLLRLPTAARMSRGRWRRFIFDAGTVLLTAGLFAWYFSFRRFDDWAIGTGSTITVLGVVLLGFVAVLAFVKVALVGQSAVDSRALTILAGAA